MKLHLPLALRSLLLSVLVSFASLSSSTFAVTYSGYDGSETFRRPEWHKNEFKDYSDKLIFSDNSARVGGVLAFSYNSTITLANNRDVIFKGNESDESGGAIFCDSTGGTYLYIYDCESVYFIGNEALGKSYLSDPRHNEGGGAICGPCNINNVDTIVFSKNRAIHGCGGAIGSKYQRRTEIYQCQSVLFSDNYAGEDGGAIGLNASLTMWGSSTYAILNNNNDLSFTRNESLLNGGAMCSGAAFIEFNQGNVIFEGNKAGKNGGAICVSGHNGVTSGDSLVIAGNNNVIFRNNSAAGLGGAIYGEHPAGSINILGNDYVLFESNEDSAIYLDKHSSNHGKVRIMGNDSVVFRNNGIAIDSRYLYLSTTDNLGSSISIYDNITITDNLWLNTVDAAIHPTGVVNGSICFIGENAHATAKVAEQHAGTVRIEGGATLKTTGAYDFKGGNLVVAQHDEPLTVLNVGSNLNFGSTDGILVFDLDYNVSSTSPLVSVGGNVTFSGENLLIDDSNLEVGTNDASIALLSIANNLIYGGKTYIYEANNNEWTYTSGFMKYILTPEALLCSTNVLHNGASVYWKDRTLYYATAETNRWEYEVKGYESGKTWRGDVLSFYDVNKKKVYHGKGTYDDSMLCWLASACNMIYYWQDTYAPLYQGSYLATNLNGAKRNPDELFRYIINEAEVIDKDSLITDALRNYFLSVKWSVKNGVFGDAVENSWAGLFDDYNHFVWVRHMTDGGDFNKCTMDGLKDELLGLFNSSSAVGLVFGSFTKGWVPGDKTPSHAITVWRCKIEGDRIIMEITDSDNDASAVSTMELKLISGDLVVTKWQNLEADENGYMDYTLADAPVKSKWIVTDFHVMKTPAGLDDMLADYNSDNTLHWTGKAEDGTWDSSVKMVGLNHHLATPADGWQKECSGGGKTIYAHAFFTDVAAEQTNFVFGARVGEYGDSVLNRVVQIDDALKVGTVMVNDDYHFGGHGSLKAKVMGIKGNLTIGSYDRWFGAEDVAGSLTIYGTPITISGSLTLEQLDNASATLQGCDVTLCGGSLWCGGMKLVRDDESGTVSLGTYKYNAVESNMQMTAGTLRVLGSGTLGCTIDLDGNVFDFAAWAMSDKSKLNEFFFDYITGNNKMVEGDVNSYRFDYKLTDAIIESNTGALKDMPIFMSDSDLTITSGAESKEKLYIGSSTGNLDGSAADIVLDESGASTINAGTVSLVTERIEETYLGAGTRITTPELLVSGCSTLTNEGHISGGIVVEADAMLRGSGSFAGTTVENGGRLMVGSSPGAPVYETLTMQSGSALIFCLDGSTAASAEKNGWGSGTHSLLTVTGADGAAFTVASGTEVQVGCSLDFLNAAELGVAQTLTLVQLSSVADAEVLAALQAGTQFRLANEDDSLEDLSSVGAFVHGATWAQGADNTLTLTFIVSSMVEDALVWSNAAGDGKWNDSSLNWNSGSAYVDGRNVAFYQGGQVEIAEDITPGDMLVSTQDDIVWSGGGHILGRGSLTKEGGGELRISMSNADYSGNVVVRGGTLATEADYALGSAWIDVKNATLDLGNKESNNTVCVYGESALCGGAGLKYVSLSEGAELTSTDGWSVGEDATLTTMGTATFVGDLTLAGGSVALGGHLTIDGDLSFAKDSCTKFDVFDSAFVSYGSYALATITGDVVGLGATSVDLSLLGGGELLYKESTGTLVLKMSSVLEWQNMAKTTWSQGSGGWIDEDGVNSSFNNNDVVVFRTGTVSISDVVEPGRVYVDTDKTVTLKTTYQKKTGLFSGSIAGDCAIEKDGNGTLRMNDGNTYSGGTILKSGTLATTGVGSYGSGAISILGGILDLAGKAVANEIDLMGEAVIKGGAKYAGEFIMVGGELLKGSVLKVVESATLLDGVMNGTISGIGTVHVTGNVALGTSGKLTTDGLDISGSLEVGTKGLTMNSGTSVITLSGGILESAGKLRANTLIMNGGKLDMVNAKPVAVTLKGSADMASDATVKLYGAFSAADLDMDASSFTLAMDLMEASAMNQPKAQKITLKDKNATSELSNGSTLDVTGSMTVAGALTLSDSTLSLHDWSDAAKPKAQTLTVKGALSISDKEENKDESAELTLTGKLTAGSLNLTNADIMQENKMAAQSISLTRKTDAQKQVITNTLTDSGIYANGSMSVAGHLALIGKSSIVLEDTAKGKAMNLAVKGNLTLGSGSSLTLSGALSATNMSLNGGFINLTSTKLQTIKVGQTLTLNAGNSVVFNFDAVEGKEYKLFTFKTLEAAGDVASLLGWTDNGSYTLTVNAKNITLTVLDATAWMDFMDNLLANKDSEAAIAAIEDEAEALVMSAGGEVEDEADEDEESVVVTTAPVEQTVDVDALIAKASDTLVQTTWGTAKASRAFVDSIGNRGQNATALVEGRGAAWAGVIGATSRLRSHGGSMGADHSLSGAVFGAEINGDAKHSFGMAIGETWGDINTISAYKVKQESSHFGLYGQSRLMQSGSKGLTFDWSAAYGRSENEADILGREYDWSQHALQLDARLTFGYALNERTTLCGFGGLQYLHIDSDMLDEGMKADSMQNLRVEVGVGASYMATDKTSVYGEVSVIGDIVRDNPSTHIGDVCRSGSNPGRAGMNLSMGATHALNESWSLNASYNIELQSRTNAHNANIGATYRF